MTLGQVSALTLANRAECLLKLKKPCAAISDCTAALSLNPDSAKALKCRGKCYRYLGKWEEANLDISAAQRIDYDPDLESLQKLVSYALTSYRIYLKNILWIIMYFLLCIIYYVLCMYICFKKRFLVKSQQEKLKRQPKESKKKRNRENDFYAERLKSKKLDDKYFILFEI